MTANCANNHLSRSWHSRHDQLDLDNIDEARVRRGRAEHDPEACASAGDERTLLARALLELPWRLRQVVVLRDVYDLSHKSIAAELGISEAAAKVRLQRTASCCAKTPGAISRPGATDPRRRKRLGQRGKQDAVQQDDGTAVAPARLLIWMTMPWPAELPRRSTRHLRALVSCEAVSAELPLVVDGSRRPSRAMADHLQSCLACQAELAGYRRLLGVLRSLRDEPVLFPSPS